MGLRRVREVTHLSNDASRCLPYRDAAFDLVLAIGVVEQIPARNWRAQVDEYYRVLAPGWHIAILDTPNRWCPPETRSIGLPLVRWLLSRLVHRYAGMFRRRTFAAVPFEEFVADGTGWRNATLAESLPSSGWRGLEDVTEATRHGGRFFRDTARSRTRRTLLLVSAVLCALARVARRPPSVCLPYMNLLFRREGRGDRSI